MIAYLARPTSVYCQIDTTTGVQLDSLNIRATEGILWSSDPVTDLEISWAEVSQPNAPGLYLLTFTPRALGAMRLWVSLGILTSVFDFQVQEDATVPGAYDYGEYLVTLLAGTSPIQGAVVRVLSEPGNRFITLGQTDANGQVLFSLPAGLYNLKFFKEGYAAFPPTQISVMPNDAEAPTLGGLYPSTFSEGDPVLVFGRAFSSDCEILIGPTAVATTLLPSVGSHPACLSFTVPSGLSAGVASVRVRKPDGLSYLLSNLLTGTIL